MNYILMYIKGDLSAQRNRRALWDMILSHCQLIYLLDDLIRIKKNTLITYAKSRNKIILFYINKFKLMVFSLRCLVVIKIRLFPHAFKFRHKFIFLTHGEKKLLY